MTKLTSLAQKYGDWDKPPVGADSDEYYPSLCLNEKQMDAMGVDNLRVGTEMTMTATVRVSNVSESKNGSRSMSFEILDAALDPKEKKPDAATVLFPNG
jgi:hypothetical protein